MLWKGRKTQNLREENNERVKLAIKVISEKKNVSNIESGIAKVTLYSLNLHSLNWLVYETTLEEYQISYFLFSTDCEMARSWLGSCAIFKAKNNIQKMAYRIISWPYVSRKYMLHHLRRNNNNSDNKNHDWHTHCSTKNSENFQKIWKKIYVTEWAFCKFPSFFDFPSNFGKFSMEIF